MRQFVDFHPADAVFVLGQHDDAAAFRGLVGEARKLRCFRKFLLFDPRCGDEFRRFAVAQRDRAGFVQEQNVHVAGGFDRPSAHRQHILLHHAVDAGDADGGEQAADGGGDQAHEERDEDRHGKVGNDLVVGG